MELDFSRPLAEQFHIDIQEYENIPVVDFPFSQRLTNTLMRHHIATVGDLLKATPEYLIKLRGFGAGRLSEVQRLFPAELPGVSDNNTSTQHTQSSFTDIQALKKVSAIRLMRFESDIYAGDFSFVNEHKWSEDEQRTIDEIQNAYTCLGPDFVKACREDTSVISEITLALDTFCRETKQLEELRILFQQIPLYRLEKNALGYIQAFAHDQDKRERLSSVYGSDKAPLAEINIHAFEYSIVPPLIKQFLRWCSFDLTQDIQDLLSTLQDKARLQTVIEMRANGCTLEQVGQKLGITRERVRQLQNKAIRKFSIKQSRTRLIAKLAAEKNGATAISPATIEIYAKEASKVLLYLLKNSTSGSYTYDEQLDLFIIGDDSLHSRAFSYVETLPELFPSKDLQKYIGIAKEEHDLPEEVTIAAIDEAYKQTGDIFHRSRYTQESIYSTILSKYYPNGIKAYDATELAQFRSHIFDEFGSIRLANNDRALASAISRICILCDRGMYKLKQKKYIPTELSQRIYNYILNSEHSIFLTNTLFAVFEDDLRTVGVSNKYYLQGILHELYGNKLVFSRDYISKDGEETSIYSSVVAFIQKSKYPVSKQQIEATFPGIPDVVISLSVNSANILNFFGEYIHASQLSISPEEESYLDRVILDILRDGEPHHIKDIYPVINMEQPEIFTRNAARHPFSAFSILEYLFNDTYQFSRPYLAMPGKEIGRPSERLHDYLYSMDEFTFDDVSEFIRDNHFFVQSILEYIDSCNNNFLVVDNERIMSISKIGVTEEHAQKIEHIIAALVDETVPICQLSCWREFPSINVPWTDWLIYSVLNKWSTQLEVAPSNNQFRLSIPLVAKHGKMDAAPFVDAYKDSKQYNAPVAMQTDDLDDIDALLMDMLDEDLLEGVTWD